MVHAVTSPNARRILVAVVFAGAIALVFVLSRNPAQTGIEVHEPGFALHDVAHEVGIDFVHHRPTLDPTLDNIAPLIAAMGASVSVVDVNNDGWPDLYFTDSRFGAPNALYLNRGDGTFVDV